MKTYKHSANKQVITVISAILVFLLALGITLYPVISNYYNEKHQSEIHTQYQEIIQQVDDSEKIRVKELADEYNTAILPGTQLSDAFSKEALLWASEDYEHQLNLAGDGTMGYVEIPLIQVNLPIYHGTDSDTLDVGIGHLLGSSLPVGGESTHSVLTAHSGMAGQKMFSDLDKLKIGDVFYLQVLDETLAYQVDQINTVLPHDTTLLGITEGGDFCTLVTCTPFGVNTHRLLVRGTRIPYEEAEVIVEEQLQEEELPKSTWEEQYIKGILFGIGAVILIAALYGYYLYWRKHRKPKKPRKSIAEKKVHKFRFRKKGKYEAD